MCLWFSRGRKSYPVTSLGILDQFERSINLQIALTKTIKHAGQRMWPFTLNLPFLITLDPSFRTWLDFKLFDLLLVSFLWLRKDEPSHLNGPRKWQIIPKRNPIVLNAAWHITDNQLIQKSLRNFILVFEKLKIIVKIKSVSNISLQMIARKDNFLTNSFVVKILFEQTCEAWWNFIFGQSRVIWIRL